MNTGNHSCKASEACRVLNSVYCPLTIILASLTFLGLGMYGFFHCSTSHIYTSKQAKTMLDLMSSGRKLCIPSRQRSPLNTYILVYMLTAVKHAAVRLSSRSVSIPIAVVNISDTTCKVCEKSWNWKKNISRLVYRCCEIDQQYVDRTLKQILHKLRMTDSFATIYDHLVAARFCLKTSTSLFSVLCKSIQNVCQFPFRISFWS